MAADLGSPELTCESCGSTETVLWAVHRIYITPAEPGFEDVTETIERTLTEIEHWCIACCASYPHEQIGLEHPVTSSDVDE